jgi:hypothetical protein
MTRNQFNAGDGSRPGAWCVAVCLAVATFAWIALSATVGGRAYAATDCPGSPGMALTLAGGTSPTDQIGVDDDLELQLNGSQFFLDDDGLAQNFDPFHFNAQHGDQLRVIARNSPSFGGNEYIGPGLYLYCDANGAQQVLDADGYTNPSGAAGEVFYDQTFTVDFAPPTPAAAASAPTGQRAAAKRRCKKKFPKGPRRTKCLKKAKKLPV